MRFAKLSAIAAFLIAGCAAGSGATRACNGCPAMVVIQGGAFAMGAPANEPGRFDEEGPVRTVRIVSFAASLTPTTRGQYAGFADDTARDAAAACNAMSDEGEWRATPGLSWRNPGFEQTDDHPAVCVSWEDAQAYVQWLSQRMGQRFRLLTEAEFEYAARAGASTAFPWGEEARDICSRANSFDLAARRLNPDWPSPECDDGYARTSPVTAFPANAFGLYGTTGNVFQWVEDCFTDSYQGAPTDGAARGTSSCEARVIRGGSWLNSARGLRAAMRDRDRQQDRYTNVGFRIARDV